MRRRLVGPSPRLWVVDELQDAPRGIAATATACVTRPPRPHSVLINLCRTLTYQSLGYYCSLLAEAWGCRAVPSAEALLDLTEPAAAHRVVAEVGALWTACGGNHQGTLRVVAGTTSVPACVRFARRVFQRFLVPVLEVDLDGETVKAVRLGDATQLSAAERAALEAADWTPSPRPRSVGARSHRLGIVRERDVWLAPSDADALARFAAAAQALGLQAEFLEPDEPARILEVDALLLRVSTHVRHPCYELARAAEDLGRVVVDDPASMRTCTNKVFEAALFQRLGVPAPPTRVVGSQTLAAVARRLGFPLVLKAPDGFASRGVFRVEGWAELHERSAVLFASSALIVAQGYAPSPFDWRVGVFGHRPLYVCRYWMSGEHWQVVRHDEVTRSVEGSHDTLRVEDAPPAVVSLACAAAAAFGDGLYGVDIKETPQGLIVIEVNDAPSLEHGVEDQLLGDALYADVVRELWGRLDDPGRRGAARQWRQTPSAQPVQGDRA